MRDYFQMIKWMRPAHSAALDLFCEIYLEPTFGRSDTHGNYIKIIDNPDGSRPNLCFTAHSDTVHNDGGIQDLKYEGNFIFSHGEDCLGADCTTGVWLILEMIDAQVPGVYVIHAEEEIGCIGSRKLVEDRPEWLDHVEAVISFDRKGKDSVVTHQLGQRTASDAFAKSFAKAVNMPNLKPDPDGVYTDSNEYADIVSECTNISVGYFAQHTASECQDINFLRDLRDNLLSADWSQLVFSRDPSDKSSQDMYQVGYYGRKVYSGIDSEQSQIQELVYEYPEEVGEYLYNLGFTADAIAEEMGIVDNKYLTRFLDADFRERKVG